MIRIDEIYYNTFVPIAQSQPSCGIHWFDPFGSTDFHDMCNVPPIDGVAEKRIVFWDQEPLHRDRVKTFFDQFTKNFQSKKLIIVTSEHNSENVSWVCDTYGAVGSYYFFHGWAALDWYRGYNRSFLNIPFSQRIPTYTFLCPNNIIGGRRQHRLKLLAELVDKQLIADNLISFPETCPYEKKTVTELCNEYQITLGPVNLPLTIDHGVNYATNSHQIDMWSLANQSLIQVVTETVYTGNRQHLTEKTFKPIVMQQPFILVSCRGSLEYLRHYGFKTFGAFWNEDYDFDNDDTRITKISQLLKDLNDMSAKEKSQLHKHLATTVEHNYHWFYSHNFEQSLWNELTTAINKW